jgi:uncharacterized protein (TIGR03663 family)
MNIDSYKSEKESVVQDQPGRDMSWLICAGIITAVAACLRFYDLALKPLHHDEGVNGFFLTNLVRDGVYKYDPANYHGPTLYYIALPFVELFGLKTIPIRVSVAIFGVLTVVLAFYLKRYIGRTGSLLAALFLALSPGMVFISRYFIHEIFFIFLSLAIVVAVLFFIEKRAAGPCAVAWMVLILFTCFLPSSLNLASYLGGQSEVAMWAFRIAFFIVESVLVYYVVRMLINWDEGRPIYLLLASASASLLFATKETTFITLGTMLIAFFCIWIWRAIHAGDAYEKHWFNALLALHVIACAAAVYYRQHIIDGGKWLYENFLGQDKSQEGFVFYSIVFLAFTAVVTWIIFIISLRKNDDAIFDEPVELTWKNFSSRLGTGCDRLAIIAAVAIVFIYLGVLFFSSFFTYKDGVGKAFEAYAIWSKTGSKDHTMHGWVGYLKWMMKVESPLLILSMLGSVMTMLWARARFAMFAALWAGGLFAAYSIIPYKTPWLALSFLLPMCIVAGYALGQLIESKNVGLKVAAVVLAISGTSVLTYQTYSLNFVRYDDEEMVYVYAHTKRGLHDLIEQIEYYAEKSGKGKDVTIEIVSPDYWPMTWYLVDYSHANFHGRLVDANTAEMIVAKKDDQDADVIRKYSTHYKYVGVYPLRPGVNLVLLVKKGLADPNAMDPYKIVEYETIPGYTN